MPRPRTTTTALQVERISRRPGTLEPGEGRAALLKRLTSWEREASAWTTYLTGLGQSPTEVAAALRDALGPRPGGPAQDPLTAQASGGRQGPAATDPTALHRSTLLPAFRWADRLPLPPAAVAASEPSWPHPLEPS